MHTAIVTDTPRNLDIVRSYLDADRQTFGFYPTTWIRDAIAAQRTLIATADDHTHAILIHGSGSDGTLRCLIAYTCPDARLLHFATSLIATATHRADNTNVTRLQAIVATDLEANEFWRAIGFSITSQRRPSRGVRRLANIYHRDHPQRAQYYAEWTSTLRNAQSEKFLKTTGYATTLFHRYTQRKARIR